jgi:hypothetical protein
MRENAGFWAEMKSPTGVLIEVETQSLRELVCQIRFLAATKSAKVLARGPIPANSAPCARCQDLFIVADRVLQNLCPDCLDAASTLRPLLMDPDSDAARSFWKRPVTKVLWPVVTGPGEAG